MMYGSAYIPAPIRINTAPQGYILSMLYQCVGFGNGEMKRKESDVTVLDILTP